MASILISGGSGFVGLKLSKSLLERGNHVDLFDIIAPPGEGECGKVTFVKEQYFQLG
jgi:nucleoside-diphosphate-sugar epimerase